MPWKKTIFVVTIELLLLLIARLQLRRGWMLLEGLMTGVLQPKQKESALPKQEEHVCVLELSAVAAHAARARRIRNRAASLRGPQNDRPPPVPQTCLRSSAKANDERCTRQ